MGDRQGGIKACGGIAGIIGEGRSQAVFISIGSQPADSDQSGRWYCFNKSKKRQKNAKSWTIPDNWYFMLFDANLWRGKSKWFSGAKE